MPSGGASGQPAGSGTTSGTAAGAAGGSSTGTAGAGQGAGGSGSTSGGAQSGAGGSGASSGASTGGATTGSASGSGASGGASGASGYPTPFPTGMSMGCNTAPPAGGQHLLALNTCPGTCNWPCEAGTSGCATDPEPPDCVSPCFAPGGIAGVTSDDGGNAGKYNFVKRSYSLTLPTNYDPTKAYPLMLQGGGCAAGSTSAGGGFTVASAGVENPAVIQVGLQYVAANNDDHGNSRAPYPECFADGAAVCAALPQNLPLCVNNPEIAYINGVIADVESKLCVAKDQVFIGGYSSGAWEAMTMGCALADQIRGIATVFGGLRIHRPACAGPMAAIMVTGTADSTNPIGPLVAGMPYPSTGTPLMTAQLVTETIGWLDSYGSAPERDDILQRNGCIGTATTMYDAAYPQCLKYTGCPTNYPVVWCPLIGVSHGYELATSNGVDYVLGSDSNPLLWGFLRNLPPL
jgi:poly(3-hydroxybutyrate) depolymerase